MLEVRVGENELFDSVFRRFKKKCVEVGVLVEFRKREYYESLSVRRKKKLEAVCRRKCR